MTIGRINNELKADLEKTPTAVLEFLSEIMWSERELYLDWISEWETFEHPMKREYEEAEEMKKAYDTVEEIIKGR